MSIFGAFLRYLIVVVFFSYHESAIAYVDPGSGSYIVQIILGSIAAIVLFLRSHWIAVKGFFQNLLNSKKKKE